MAIASMSICVYIMKKFCSSSWMCSPFMQLSIYTVKMSKVDGPLESF